ncbi:MAG TPA: enoyl-CoA hydratase/isomerase family protein [Spirochaetota bacterium]|nr:enoyl-CoA hydratase/isomerase family protein [Spirochaetota bacterium]HPI91293.1 enoyl-CoA hydratase/isomerase family protein [Spirochaetota bacterium]HPR48368.1 enoyl-CoA hydratase/isomerase family protein [Spirochaetota bacterium]
MAHESLILEQRGRVALVTINRPDKMNAFDEELFFRLESVTERLRARLPRAVVLTGAGDRAFSAGFDVNPANPMVKRIIDAATHKDPGPARDLIRAIRKAVDGFVSLPVPLIAAVNGIAYGGGAELAMRCDMRVLDPVAVICFSETKLGLMPDWGGGTALIGIAGPSRAAELIFTGRKVGAVEAYTMGLANRVSEKGRALEEALSLADTIASNGPRAVRSALTLIRENAGLTGSCSLEMEERLAAELVASGECFHGVAAFLEKKKPDFPDSD